MKKSKFGSIFIVIITLGLLGIVIYFSFLLNNRSDTSVTQIKKTKASAQTYHTYLALNSQGVGSSSETLIPSPTEALLAYKSTSPTPTSTPLSPTPTRSPTTAAFPTVVPTDVPTITTEAIPTKLPTPTKTLLVYRTMSITVTPPIHVSSSSSTTLNISPTQTQTKSQSSSLSNKTLPETGWVQLSTVFFVIAATVIFVSFLF